MVSLKKHIDTFKVYARKQGLSEKTAANYVLLYNSTPNSYGVVPNSEILGYECRTRVKDQFSSIAPKVLIRYGNDNRSFREAQKVEVVDDTLITADDRLVHLSQTIPLNDQVPSAAENDTSEVDETLQETHERYNLRENRGVPPDRLGI